MSRKRAAAWAAACALAGGGLAGGAVATAGPALAAGQNPVCADGTCSVTFAAPGLGQSFMVPAGVSSLQVSTYGATGGGCDNEAGGDGALVTAALNVAAGSSLGIDVGGTPGNCGSSTGGGINGGGTGGGANSAAGGGATDVKAGGTTLLEAGGGGGAGGSVFGLGNDCPSYASVSGAGGDADSPGGPGQPYTNGTFALVGGQGGLPGTVTGGPGGGGQGGITNGTDPCGGTPADGLPGNPASGGTGGAVTAQDINLQGGAGGGGYYGGGQGGVGASDGYVAAGAGGGGGGASYIAPGISAQPVNDTGNPFSDPVNGGNGEVVLSWSDQVSITGAPLIAATQDQPLGIAGVALLSGASDTVPGGTLTPSIGSSPEPTSAGGSVTANGDGSFTYTPPSATFTGADTFSYTVTDQQTGEYATGTATVNVQPAVATTATTLSSSGSPSVTGQPVTYTATVSPVPDGGTVSFTDDGNAIAGCAGLSVSATGQALCTVSYASPGTPSITASYGGDASFAASTSAALTQMVQASTLTTVSSSLNPSVPGQQVTFTATVEANQPGPGLPTGTVTFSDGGTPLGTVTLTNGTATLTTSSLPIGNDAISVVYSGDSNFEGSTSAALTQAVSAVAPTVTAISAPATAATGTRYSAQFTVTGTPAPTVTLGAGAPSWLSVTSTGAVTGLVPAGTTSFSYAVTATNSAGTATSATVTVAVSDKADVQAALACPSSLTAGASGICTLTVTNAGPALAVNAAAGAIVTGPLAVTGCSDGCSSLLGVLSWSLGSLPAGQSVTLTIDVTAKSAGTAIIAAVDGSANPDPNLLNNIAGATVKITKS